MTNIKPTQSVRAAFDAAVERLGVLGFALQETKAPFDNPGFDVRNIEAGRKTIAARTFRDGDQRSVGFRRQGPAARFTDRRQTVEDGTVLELANTFLTRGV